MKKLHFLFLFAVALTFNLFGQSKIKSGKPNIASAQMNKLIGTWIIIGDKKTWKRVLVKED